MHETDMTADSPELVRQTTVRVLDERIRLLGIDRSGAYEHYKLQLSLGFPIRAGELAILKFIRERLPKLRSYHEIGSGMGTLPLILACENFAAVGIERDEKRHLTALAILRDLSDAVPQIEGMCRLIGGSFPDVVTDLDVSESLAILTDIVATQTPRDAARFGHGLARYRYVIMDLQRFCTKRDSTEEQDRLIEELDRCGLTAREEIADLDSQGRYMLFESRVASERRPLPGDVPPALRERAAPQKIPLEKKAIAAPPPKEDAKISNNLSVAVSATELKAAPAQPVVQAKSEAAVEPMRATRLPSMPKRAKRSRFGGWLGLSALLVIAFPSLLAIAYYGFIASKQYVTTFQFAVRGPSQAALAKNSGGTAMTSAGAMSPDSFVVTDYVNSPQAIADVEQSVDLKTIFSRPDIDFWARLRLPVLVEEMTKYWNNMVSARFDLISGNITVTVRAFTPEDSQKVANALVAASDAMFRKLNLQIQKDFVRVADDVVARAQQDLMTSTQAVLAFREKSGLVDPGKTADAGASIIDDLRRQLAAVQGQYNSTRATAHNSPALTAMRQQIATLEEQIRRESRLGASQVKAVSADTLAKYQTLELERQTAERLYGEAVSLRTQAYMMAQSQQSYLGLFSAPSLPEASLYPDRPRAIATVILACALAWFIGMLIVYAVRDHLM